MSPSLRLSTLTAAIVLAVAGACSDDGGAVGPDAAQDAALDGATTETDAAPARSRFGLDARPANPTCLAPSRPAKPGAVKLERVYQSVAPTNVVLIAQRPNDASRWFAVQRTGAILSFASSGAGSASVVADLGALAGVPVNADGDGGLLGFAFHPAFATNGRAYVSWTSEAGDALVGYLTSTNGGQTFTAYTSILAFPRGAQHFGSTVAFGKDGRLYVSYGDAGGSFRGQDKALPFYAKILRLDVDAAPPPGQGYVVPADNPFVSGGAEPATYALGFRNPFRMSFDRGTGDLWVADVGEDTWEEVDVVKAGGNYGWPCREGAHDLTTTAQDPVLCPSMLGLTEPVAEIQHGGDGTHRAITGGVVYRGKALPSFAGTYVFGDSSTREIFSLAFDPTTGAPTRTLLNADGVADGAWVDFAEDVDGEVYAVGLDGPIYKLVPAGQETPTSFPDRLSRTGCVDAADARRPAPGLVPYGVNAPFWSDGADKTRWIALPDGKRVAVKADGDLDLPIGSVVMKTFSLASRPIETRLLVRHDDGDWAGYDYEWNDAGTDALLLTASKTKTVGSASWYFPSRSDCVSCHTAAAGRTLGLEVGQLNGELLYASTNRLSNQLETWEHIGLFDAPLGKETAALPALPDPLGGAAVGDRARAYLHVNCSQCHRPPSTNRSNLDLRFGTALQNTKACGVRSALDDLGVPGAALLVPGVPARSLVSLRAHAMGVNRMPPLATNELDTAGTAVLDDWIRSLTSCP